MAKQLLRHVIGAVPVRVVRVPHAKIARMCVTNAELVLLVKFLMLVSNRYTFFG